MDEYAIRDRLPHVWHAFFARFGRLREIQKVAIPALLSGADALVMAPTASGKTEAILAPLVERLFKPRAPDAHLVILVVAPTRALCNDLYRRLRPPFQACRLSIGVRTSDSSSVKLDAPPHCVITTPESLDSMLARRPRLLRQLRAMVMDELHLLHGTPRGDQLAVLVQRVKRIAAERPQLCAASATLHSPEALAALYLGAEFVSLKPKTIQRRAIAAEVAEVASLDQAAEGISGLFDEDPRRKILVFCNTRAQVEDLSSLIKRMGAHRLVFAHHGSLSTAERLRVERGFLRASRAICVATMTLELGIDIGDVDRVVLLAPPPNVSSLVQRVGRANRKSQTAHVLCLYQGVFEKQRFEHLLSCAHQERLFGETPAFRPTAIVQQGLSLVFQSPKSFITAGVLAQRLPPSVQRVWGVEECAALLRGAAEQNFLRPLSDGRFTAEPKAQAAYEQGRLHAMIGSKNETEVIDAVTRRVVGSVRFGQREAKAIHAGTLRLSLGGRTHQAVAVRENKLFVRAEAGEGSSRFISSEAPRYSRALAQDLARSLGLALDVLTIQALGEGQWRMDHFQARFGPGS